MKSIYKTTILALAAICLLANPSLSNPWDRGATGIHHGGWMLLAEDITAEELDNMTMEEIRSLKQQEMQKIQNMTPYEIRGLMEQKRERQENMTLAELQNKNREGMLRGQNRGGHKMAGTFDGFGLADGQQLGDSDGRARCQMDCSECPHGGMWILLLDDETRDDMQNMTLAEIDELRLEKAQELENMTLSEIQDLKEQKLQELGNMTLSEIKDQRPRVRGHVGPMGFQSQEGNVFRDGQSWMPGVD